MESGRLSQEEDQTITHTNLVTWPYHDLTFPFRFACNEHFTKRLHVQIGCRGNRRFIVIPNAPSLLDIDSAT